MLSLGVYEILMYPGGMKLVRFLNKEGCPGEMHPDLAIYVWSWM